MPAYRGRFAPSPTGPLHAGSLVAALASWLDARAHGGSWLIRIEDVDVPRCVAGADQVILHQLQTCGFVSDEAPVWQSTRTALYRTALDQLIAHALAYPCACSRKDVELALQEMGAPRERHAELVYPGTCRAGLTGKNPRAWRLRTDLRSIYIENRPLAPVEYALSAIFLEASNPTTSILQWHDRWLGPQTQNLPQAVGDFVLYRADGLFAYQLAVVVDDAAQGITDVVRGADLADNTARQIALQRLLGLPQPRYLHTPLVLSASGEKLSKQNAALALDLSNPMIALNEAASVLGLARQSGAQADGLAAWVKEWRSLMLVNSTSIPA